MTTNAIAITEDSFKITGIGVIVELQHKQKGLAENTMLTSEITGKSWLVKFRMLFDHAVDKQIVFENEPTQFMLAKFESFEKRQVSINKIIEKEKQCIYQYLIQPIDHDEKPVSGEHLKIKTS